MYYMCKSSGADEFDLRGAFAKDFSAKRGNFFSLQFSLEKCKILLFVLG